MSEREAEPIFCSECQNEVEVDKARILDGRVLCPADLAKRPLLQRLRARKLPEDIRRRGGGIFKGFFTLLTGVMFLLGAVLVFDKNFVVAGVYMLTGSIFVAFFGILAGDVVDLLLDIFDQLKRINRL